LYALPNVIDRNAFTALNPATVDTMNADNQNRSDGLMYLYDSSVERYPSNVVPNAVYQYNHPSMNVCRTLELTVGIFIYQGRKP
jgi:hypothetical protein